MCTVLFGITISGHIHGYTERIIDAIPGIEVL